MEEHSISQVPFAVIRPDPEVTKNGQKIERILDTDRKSPQHNQRSNTNHMSTTQRFHDGERVIIDGLKLAKLNGTHATILSFDSDADRFRVTCDSGEKVRVRPQNLFPATESVQEPSPPASSSSSRPDATIFVQGDRFVLPGVTAPPPPTKRIMNNSKDGTTHRIPLPPGHWEVRLLEHDEHDPTAPLVRTTLVAVGKAQGEGDTGAKNHDEWNALKGLTCTRVIELSEEDDAERLSAEVKESVLEVSVPKLCDDVEEATKQDEPVAAVTAPPPAGGDVLSDVTAEKVNAFDGRTTEMNFDVKVPPPVQRICSAEAHSRRPGRLRRMRSAGAAMPSKRSAAAGSRRRAWKAAARETMTRETIAMEA